MQGTDGVQATETVVHAAEALVKIIVMDVEHTLFAAADWVLSDKSAAEPALRDRTGALGRLGQIYLEAADAVGGETARRKWRADTLRQAGGGSGEAAAASLEGMLSGLSLRRPSCAEVRDTMTVRGAEGKQHTLYQIGCFDDDSEWTVAKRFSDFDELREFLEEKGVEIGGAAFPSKTLLSSVCESTVVREGS